MDVKERLIEQFKLLSARVMELKREVEKSKETVEDLGVKLKAAEKRKENIVYEQDGLHACF